MSQVFLTLGFALVTAAILALSAIAFTLEYAVTNVANLAHGEILTCGAYAALIVLQHTGNPLLSALAAAAVGGAVAWIMHFAVVERFIRQGTNSTSILIVTLGMSFIIQNLLVIFFGASNVAYTLATSAPRQVGPFLWTDKEIEILVSAIAITAALFALLKWTRFGKALRAVSQNRELARVSGINARAVAALTWILAGAIAGYAGFILAESIGTFSPYFGFSFFLITLTAAVAGGLGRAFSTLVGAVIVGVILEFAGTVISSSYNLAVAFAVLALVILFRPRGLFSNARRTVFE